MVRWVVGSIVHGGPIELFLVPASAPWLVYVLSCLWDGAYKRIVAAIRKEQPIWWQQVSSRYLNGPFPYV